MKTLIAVVSGLGFALGLVMGVLAHARNPSVGGYTFYTSSPPRRYADFLPVSHPWFPGLAGYALTGLGIGLLVAVVLGLTGFRLARVRRSAVSARR